MPWLDNTFVTGRIYGTAAQMTVQADFMMAHASDTGKIMGLSAYGKYDAELAKRVWELLPEVNDVYDVHPTSLDVILPPPCSGSGTRSFSE